jgi:hypothetical protein
LLQQHGAMEEVQMVQGEAIRKWEGRRARPEGVWRAPLMGSTGGAGNKAGSQRLPPQQS